MPYALTLQKLPAHYALCTFKEQPAFLNALLLQPADFLSLTATGQGLSLICEQSKLPQTLPAQKNWLVFRIQEAIDLSASEMLHALVDRLAVVRIKVLIIAHPDASYLLVQEDHAGSALYLLGIYCDIPDNNLCLAV